MRAYVVPQDGGHQGRKTTVVFKDGNKAVKAYEFQGWFNGERYNNFRDPLKWVECEPVKVPRSNLGVWVESDLLWHAMNIFESYWKSSLLDPKGED